MFYKAMLKKKNKKAFTLIELIVVIAIIGVLVAILVPVMSSFVGSASDTALEANARTVYGVAQAQQQSHFATGAGTDAGTLKSEVLPMVTGAAAGGDFTIYLDDNNNVTAVSYSSAGKSATYPPPAK